MKFKRKSLLTICLLVPCLFFGQIKISENIQKSALTNQDAKALYFVDFWATWCRPCINASKYLESLQKQYSDNFYIVSLTQESPEVVNRFMAKHDLELAVAIDYRGETFIKNNISSLPYGILFNADGTKLWEGHPADFKFYHLEGYLETNKKQIAIDSFLKLQEYVKESQTDVVETLITSSKDFSFSEFTPLEEEISLVQVINESGFLKLKGTLQDIMGYVLSSGKNQVEIPEHLNKYYSMSFKEGSKAFLSKERYILKALKLKRIKAEKEGDAIVLEVVTPKFWDTKQIDWGTNNQKFLIGDADIQADNVTLNEVVYKLSCLLEMPIVFKEDPIKEAALHDWQIHYKYFELMSSNLSDYGISIEKKVTTYPQYVYVVK